MPRHAILINNKQYVFGREMSMIAMNRRAYRKKAETYIGTMFLVMAILFFLAFAISAWYSGISINSPNVTNVSLGIGLLFAQISIAHFHQTKAMKIEMPLRAIGDAFPSVQPMNPELKPIDIASLMDQTAANIIDQAFELASKFGHAKLEPLHLFIAALSDENASAIVGRLQIAFEKIKEPLGRRLATRQISETTMLAEQSEQVLLQAFANAYAQGRRRITTVEIFFEAFNQDTFIQELFFDQGISSEQFANMVAWVRIHEKLKERAEVFRHAAQYKPTGAMNRSMTSVATPTLDAVSEDLTTAAVQGRTGLLVEREQEIEQVFRIIDGGRQSAVLVGSDGVGKQAIIEGIASLMTEEHVPKRLQDKRLVRLSLSHLIAGAEPQQAQERLMLVLSEVIRSGNIVLVLTDLEQVSLELAQVLGEYLSDGSMSMIATTSPQGYTSTIERSVLGRVFEKVMIEEPEPPLAIQILQSKALTIEAEFEVSFTYMALESMVKLSDRFMHETYLPKKAIELARETALMVAKERGKDALVIVNDVEKIIAEKTGIPATHVEADEKEMLLHLEERMHGRVVGQEEAIKAVAGALRRARTQLQSEKRPIATFLFLGPTGVGKTELAKTIAQTFFGSEETMVRFDMSEYQQPDSIARLIGTPGSNEGGILTEAVRQHPFSLVLLDEFEKADADILNLFLQVFDDARLTDAAGHTIDFTNTILIATSNAGTSYIQEAVKQKIPVQEMQIRLLEEELKNVYRPELLNRFDGVIVFKPLSQEEIVEITRRMIVSVGNRLEAKGMHFKASEEMIRELAQKGYDPLFGARPLRRVVQEEVDNAIAEALLKGEVKRRDTIVLEKGGIRIEQAQAL